MFLLYRYLVNFLLHFFNKKLINFGEMVEFVVICLHQSFVINRFKIQYPKNHIVFNKTNYYLYKCSDISFMVIRIA